MIDYFMTNFQIYKTHIKPIKPKKPALIKPVKPARLGFMIKPGFYANPEYNSSFMTKISMTTQVFSGKNMEVKLAMCIQAININKGTRLASEVQV